MNENFHDSVVVHVTYVPLLEQAYILQFDADRKINIIKFYGKLEKICKNNFVRIEEDMLKKVYRFCYDLMPSIEAGSLFFRLRFQRKKKEH